jgi:Na+/H+ antiporter NhaD/arsenite permease-like protein
MIPAYAILIAVFAAITVRQLLELKIQIWKIMLAGAALALILGDISAPAAFSSINFGIIAFLIGMFIIGEAMQQSGYLDYVSSRLFGKAGGAYATLFILIFGAGLLSMLFMNDTLAIIGTPIVISLARKRGMRAEPFLMALAFSITTGSVTSPIGNPQNLLIAASSRLGDPFLTFFGYLLVPTMINLLITYAMLRLVYKHDLIKSNSSKAARGFPARRSESHSVWCVRASVILLVLGFAAYIIYSLAYSAPPPEYLFSIPLFASIPILLFFNGKKAIISKMDWGTIIFFISLFIIVGSVWDSGVLQSLVSGSSSIISSALYIFPVSILFSQLISNVPLVALYLKILETATKGAIPLMALAASSTIAGNLSILGAASNVIIIQGTEKKGERTINMKSFMKIGIPLTIIESLVYAGFLGML